jgi:hypothetical protein
MRGYQVATIVGLGVAALSFGMLGMTVFAQGAKGGDTPAKTESKTDSASKTESRSASKSESKSSSKSESKSASKTDSSSGESSSSGDFPEKADLEALMKELGKQKRASKKAEEDKNSDSMKTLAKAIEHYAGKMVEKDHDDKRKKAEDYQKWAKDLEAKAKELAELTGAKTPDWGKITAKKNEVMQACETCHAKYDPPKKRGGAKSGS